MSYEEWIDFVNELKVFHEKLNGIRDIPLNRLNVHAAMMASDQAKWMHELVVDMMYKAASITVKHEATS